MLYNADRRTVEKCELTADDHQFKGYVKIHWRKGKKKNISKMGMTREWLPMQLISTENAYLFPQGCIYFHCTCIVLAKCFT